MYFCKVKESIWKWYFGSCAVFIVLDVLKISLELATYILMVGIPAFWRFSGFVHFLYRFINFENNSTVGVHVLRGADDIIMSLRKMTSSCHFSDVIAVAWTWPSWCHLTLTACRIMTSKRLSSIKFHNIHYIRTVVMTTTLRHHIDDIIFSS